MNLQLNILNQEKKNQFFEFVGGGLLPPKFVINANYKTENQKRNIKLIDLNEISKVNINITSKEIKDYIRWIGNRRLIQLGLEPIYQIDKNPLTWLDTMLNAVEHMNFFEGRATEYSKASTQGTWTEAFS